MNNVQVNPPPPQRGNKQKGGTIQGGGYEKAKAVTQNACVLGGGGVARWQSKASHHFIQTSAPPHNALGYALHVHRVNICREMDRTLSQSLANDNKEISPLTVFLSRASCKPYHSLVSSSWASRVSSMCSRVLPFSNTHCSAHTMHIIRDNVVHSCEWVP